MFLFLPFSAFCQQEDSIIAVQGGAAVFGEFYIATNTAEVTPEKFPSQIDTKEKKTAAEHPKPAHEKKQVSGPAVKAPLSSVKLRGSEERFTRLQNLSHGKCGTSASQGSAQALLTKLLIFKPLFLSEKKQASALQSAAASSFVSNFKTRGPPQKA